MLNSMLDVTFRVQADTKLGETVCVVGNCTELGNWKPENARELSQESKTSQSELWSKLLRFPIGQQIEYRYFIGRIIEPDHEGDAKSVMVRRWETNIKPRTINVTALSDESNDSQGNFAEFGVYDGKRNEDKGWLTGQTEIQLRLHRSPMKWWKTRHRSLTHSVKCTPLDLKYRDMTVGVDEDDEDSCHDLTSWTSAVNTVQVSVLNGRDDIPQEQAVCGAVYNHNDYMVFRTQTLELETLGYQFDFYEHEPSSGGQENRYIGFSYLLPFNLRDSHGIVTLPINGLKHKPIGELTVDYLMIKSLKRDWGDMRVSYSKHWKRQRRPLDVGHRGMGSSYSAKKCAAVRENTIASLAQAGGHGADFVEFDVQLSKDNVPVIYHDFRVCLTINKKNQEDHEYFEVPLRDFNLAQLQMLKLEHVSLKDKTSSSSESSSDHDDTAEDRHPFPTLKECFEKIDPHLGFNIEIKYCMEMKSGGLEDGLSHYMERNEYLDHILRVVLDHSGNRRLVFSCFDPDICTMVRLKQNKYPVLFLTQGETEKYPPYIDWRTWNVNNACCFGICENMLGLSLHTEDLLKDPSLIALGKNRGLVLFCWGEENQDQENVRWLKEQGMDGIIADGIHELKDNSENVFKIEYQAKLEMLNTAGVCPDGARTLTGVLSN